MEKSRFIVEYSQDAAEATKYTPEMLVGIRKYVDAAIKKFDAREKNRQEEKRKAREEELQIQYEHYRDHEIKRIKSSLSPDELAEMESTIRADLKQRASSSLRMGLRQAAGWIRNWQRVLASFRMRSGGSSKHNHACGTFQNAPAYCRHCGFLKDNISPSDAIAALPLPLQLPLQLAPSNWTGECTG